MYGLYVLTFTPPGSAWAGSYDSVLIGLNVDEAALERVRADLEEQVPDVEFVVWSLFSDTLP